MPEELDDLDGESADDGEPFAVMLPAVYSRFAYHLSRSFTLLLNLTALARLPLLITFSSTSFIPLLDLDLHVGSFLVISNPFRTLVFPSQSTL